MVEQLDRIEPPDLWGDVALVTGAGRGIGKAIPVALAIAGARVVLTARSASEIDQTLAEIESSGGQALAVPADVSTPAAVASLVDRAQVKVGTIRVLVNNAGVLEPVALLWEVDPDKWWHSVEINLRGPFLCMRAVLPGMIARGRGRGVNLASRAAKVPIADGTAYAASKTGLVRVTESLAWELEGCGVS